MKTNISISQIVKDGFKDFKKIILQFFIFEASYKTITSFILIPFILSLSHILFKFFRVRPLTNAEIFNFILSLKGLTIFTTLTLLALIVIFIEIGVIIAMSEQIYYSYKPSILTSLRITFNRIPKIIGIGTIPMIIFMLFLIPFEGLFISSSIFTIIKIPRFISNEIQHSYLYESIFILLAFLVFIIFIRYIFVFHSIIIENLNVSKALKKSLKLTKKVSFKLIISVFIWNMIVLLISILVTILLSTIIFVITLLFKLTLSKDSFFIIFITFIIILLFVYSLLVTPFSINIITKIYYAQRKILGDNINEDFNNKNSNKKLLLSEKKIYSYLIKYKKLSIFLFIISIIASIFFNFKTTGALITSTPHIKIISHRANCENEPENSISALKNSIKHKTDFAEIDVQESSDGAIVLMHDANLKRIAGLDTSIGDLSLREIQNIDISKNYNKKFNGEKIPTLDEVIKLSKGKIRLIIELKPYKNSETLAKKVVDLIEANNAVNTCFIQSLDYTSLLKVKELNPYISTGYILYMATGDITELNVDFYTIEQTIVSEELLNSIHAKHKEVFVWTIDTEEDMSEILDYNVDGIITDNPTLLKKTIKDFKN
ncbi:glycerophosphoryl diester phosphodiesterase [Clostridium cavendishii DSM 21758]|uniref:Glycerophosphoryl diester phosphodiesterase n=1 Tax=Clostridium cavendishii DSM 21758 TaxID=1121302 RepID=A0A1M6BB25_9CLOT|nr:glycerophosphodiester phosphodiesterase [Clostridium cavendishii]SHI45951.1 glycerophosphoryl diester phosphodiesterase [Clostridium cavendishii DSM 21758]